MIKKYINSINRYIAKHQKVTGLTLIVISVLALVGSSLYISQKSALIQLNNHDNLIDGYMFESPDIFREAIFPGAHTFLLKWPIFILSSVFGNVSEVYIITTIILYLLTVCGFLFVIYLLTRKNLFVTALSGLILTCTLLLVPPQPSPGALLPLNMAMTTTRNIEFLFLFGFIYLILKAKKILSWEFVLATSIMIALGASDKYYLMIGLLAAIMYIAFSWRDARKTKVQEKLAYLPLASFITSYILANFLLVIINKFGITTIDSATNAAPFAIVSSVWSLFEAIAGGLQGVIANYGADIFGKNLNISLLPYIFNGIILCLSILAVYALISRKVRVKSLASYQFTIWLILTFIGSFIIFIAAEHDYLSDGRYLTGAIFAGIASFALVLDNIKWKDRYLFIAISCGVIILLSPLYILAARTSYAKSFDDTQRLIGNRLDMAADILTKNNVDIFVGDYWFTTPVRLKTSNRVATAPMATEFCDRPNYFLTSRAWYRPSSSTITSALYILRDGERDANTFNHGCSMESLNNRYGAPSKEFVIREENGKPIDIIRLYPYDIREKIRQ